MSMAQRGELGGWQSRTTFVLMLSASAIGLGSLWRFSYLVGEHGGGLFVLAYLACLLLVAVPVMIAEVIIGSHGRASPVEALRWAADRSLLSRNWMLLGQLACLTGVLILSYYVVVAGWARLTPGICTRACLPPPAPPRLPSSSSCCWTTCCR